MVIAHQTFGDMRRWNPHSHAILLEGGFDEISRENLAQYMARPLIRKGRVLFHTHYNEYFKENVHMFEACDFLAELTQHIPPKGVQPIRRYGLYLSRIKGAWETEQAGVRAELTLPGPRVPLKRSTGATFRLPSMIHSILYCIRWRGIPPSLLRTGTPER